MTHLGVGFLVPAVSPSPATWSFLGPADLTSHHLGRQPRARQLQGGPRRKELGLCQPQARPTPSCLCGFAHPLALTRGSPFCKSCSSSQDHLLWGALLDLRTELSSYSLLSHWDSGAAQVQYLSLGRNHRYHLTCSRTFSSCIQSWALALCLTQGGA